MAGIYIHIPFCKSRCTYCDFFTQTNFELQDRLVKMMCKELIVRKDYLQESIETIYFGGGTPSTLSIANISSILQTIKQNFQIEAEPEITLEANPDDLTEKYLKSLLDTGINRLSIGIQSFDNNQLKVINRRHNGQQAIDAVYTAQKAGFSNISIDLIYGLPNQSYKSWTKQVEQAIRLDIQHISAYSLMYEKGTAIWQQLQQRKISSTPEETSISMYEYLIKQLNEATFEHYEISNFAKAGFRSRHNSSYWRQTPYLGIGPSAHSYNGESRRWNIASISEYCDRLNIDNDYFEIEKLSKQDNYNDFVMVRLRTMEGISLQQLRTLFSEDYYNHCLSMAQKHISAGNLVLDNYSLRLSAKGIMISDSIIVDLMSVNE